MKIALLEHHTRTFHRPCKQQPQLLLSNVPSNHQFFSPTFQLLRLWRCKNPRAARRPAVLRARARACLIWLSGGGRLGLGEGKPAKTQEVEQPTAQRSVASKYVV